MVKTIRIALVGFFLLIFCNQADAQRHGDIGLFMGTSYYLGEINPTLHFRNTSEAYGIFYRHNFNLRYSLRTSFYTGALAGDDMQSAYPYNKLRNSKFHVGVSDLSSMFEFNFLPYISTHDIFNHSFYVTAGLSYMYVNTEKPVKGFNFPFGVGYKVNLAKRWSGGIEWTLRKTFTDEIDDLGKPENDALTDFLNLSKLNEYKQTSFPNRPDIYFYAGFFISYKFFYTRFRCPAYEDSKLVY
jgi:hypothetical protein